MWPLRNLLIQSVLERTWILLDAISSNFPGLRCLCTFERIKIRDDCMVTANSHLQYLLRKGRIATRYMARRGRSSLEVSIRIREVTVL
jgi:hypothetical protein